MGWAGVLLAANLEIQSGPHLSAEGDTDSQPAEGYSSQTLTGRGILTQSIPGFETETESRTATAPAAAHSSSPAASCLQPPIGHQPSSHVPGAHTPFPSTLTHTQTSPSKLLTHPPWVSLPLLKYRCYSLPSPISSPHLFSPSFLFLCLSTSLMSGLRIQRDRRQSPMLGGDPSLRGRQNTAKTVSIIQKELSLLLR